MTTLLEVKNLSVKYHEKIAVETITFSLKSGEILGLIGESGCGKSTTAEAIILPENFQISGEVLFNGFNLSNLSPNKLRKIRGNEISIVFQDPMTSLNPTMTIGKQVMEPLLLHKKISRHDARQQVLKLFIELGITPPEKRFEEYPHELSGGQRQRVMIAIATINEPKILIADEPTSALDATTQAQILNLLLLLKIKLQLGILLITHDLGVVAAVCDRVMVMHNGKIVEILSVDDFFYRPTHPYTQMLLSRRREL